MNNFYEVNCYVNGIKKRARKTDRHQIKIGTFPIDNIPSNDELINLAKNKVKEYIKEVTTKEASMQMIFMTIDGNIKSFQMFDEKNKHWKFNVLE